MSKDNSECTILEISTK